MKKIDLELILACLIIGLLAGTVGSLIGLGGGVITVPSLLFLSTIDPQFAHITPAIAVGTSMLLIILTALSSTLSYAKKKRVDFRFGWLMFISCGPGAVLGAYLTQHFSLDRFYLLFAIFMLVVALLLSLRNRKPQKRISWDVERTVIEKGIERKYGYHRLTALSGAFVVGICSGLFGIGGGSLLVPMMLLLFGFPPHLATATSMFTIFLTAILGSLSHLQQGNIDWTIALFLAPGAWIGGRWGAWVGNRLSGQGLLIVLRIAFILFAVYMLLKGLHVI